MKKIALLVVAIVSVVTFLILRVPVVKGSEYEKLDITSVPLRIKASVYSNKNGADRSDRNATGFEVVDNAQLYIGSIDSHVQKTENGYRLDYRGVVKGRIKVTSSSLFSFLGYTSSQEIEVSKYFSGSKDFVKPHHQENDAEIEVLWHIDEIVSIDLSN